MDVVFFVVFLYRKTTNVYQRGCVFIVMAVWDGEQLDKYGLESVCLDSNHQSLFLYNHIL